MYLVVFRNRKRADIDMPAYLEDAAAMERLAAAQPGFISFKSFVAADGEVVAISEWENDAAAKAWGRHDDHARVMARGKAEYYAQYCLLAADVKQIHRFG